MSLDKKLLDIICCPVTHSPLSLMQQTQLDELNAMIEQTKVKNRGDEVVTESLTEALVTRDGKLAYPVRDDIPVLLEDEGIPLAQLEQ